MFHFIGFINYFCKKGWGILLDRRWSIFLLQQDGISHTIVTLGSTKLMKDTRDVKEHARVHWSSNTETSQNVWLIVIFGVTYHKHLQASLIEKNPKHNLETRHKSQVINNRTKINLSVVSLRPALLLICLFILILLLFPYFTRTNSISQLHGLLLFSYPRVNSSIIESKVALILRLSF